MHLALLRLLELETLRELAKNTNARIYIGFDKHVPSRAWEIAVVSAIVDQSKQLIASVENEAAMRKEQIAFARHRPQLLRRYAGQYVAFYHGRLAGHDKDDEDLAQRMFAKFGDAPFYIARVETKPTVWELPSPELA